MRYLAFLAALLAASPAAALSVVNLSGSTQAVMIGQSGAYYELLIPPGQTRYYHGSGLQLHIPGQRVIHADPHDEYAIWPDGKLHIQRRHKAKGTVR